MIIVEIIGGLGNQMFQYALGRTLSMASGSELKLDITKFDKQDLRKYSLDKFNFADNFASKKEIDSIKFGGIINKLLKKESKKFIKEPKYSFNPEILEISDDVYLQGYWQSEKYFMPIRETLLKDFSLKEDLSKENQAILNEITSKEAVSLHIRRGDYVSNKEVQKIYGTCSLEYYKNAVDYLVQKVQNPHFFLFSDDPQWVLENLKIDHPTTIVDINSGDDGIYDIFLMKNCKHNVIANSSFSWWGAWLNENDEKIVIAPQKWFANSPLDTKDVVPENWIRM